MFLTLKFVLNIKFLLYVKLNFHYNWGLGIGDWGLGIGPNPQFNYYFNKE
jgi:hypothetical protein